MIISAHQPAYLPWAGYIERIALSEIFVILDDVQFEKNSFTNRNRIKTSNGASWLTVPVSLKGHMSSSIKDVEISAQPWQKKHWKTIQQNYQKAPYYKVHEEFLSKTYDRNWDKLNELNSYMLSYFLLEFGIKTEILYLSEIPVNGSKQDLIIDICKHCSASKFLFGPQGKDYVEEEKFSKAQVEVAFHDFQQPTYNQLWGEFIPNLSILDMMMNIEPSVLKGIYK